MQPKFVLVSLNGSSIAKMETISLLWKLQVFEEKAYLVGVSQKGDKEDAFGIEESLKELAQLADTAGLMVVDSTYQKLVLPPFQIKDICTASSGCSKYERYVIVFIRGFSIKRLYTTLSVPF